MTLHAFMQEIVGLFFRRLSYINRHGASQQPETVQQAVAGMSCVYYYPIVFCVCAL